MTDPTERALTASREAGHTPLPPDGGNLRIVYHASEVIALGNRRYDEGWDAALDAERAARAEPGLADALETLIEHHARAECYRYPECENATTAARAALEAHGEPQRAETVYADDEHVAHRGNHDGYACGFSGPHCWSCNEPWPCRASRQAHGEPPVFSIQTVSGQRIRPISGLSIYM
jgi:hypothetical protein